MKEFRVKHFLQKPKRWIPWVACVILLASLFGNGWSKEPVKIVYVDNLGGSDGAGDGSQAKPFGTIMRGVKELRPGCMLNVANTETAYHESVRIQTAGTTEEPIILEGNGAVNSGMMRRPLQDWKAEGGDVFSLKLPNNAWGMQRRWESSFDIVRFDGKPGRNATSRDALEPGAYFLYKNQKELKTDPLHNTLFVKLAKGKTPADISVETISIVSLFCVMASHVTVRDFISEYAGDDGFASVRPAADVLFERVESRYNMDQGISHHGSRVLVRNSHFHHNAGSCVVDVYPEARIRYENCLMEDDTWRGGVEFYSGHFEMVDCVIRGNPKKAMLVTRGADVMLRNCLLTGQEEAGVQGLQVTEKSKLTMENCTLANFNIGLIVKEDCDVAVRNSAFFHCKSNWEVTVPAAPEDLAFRLSKAVLSAGNAFESSPFVVKEATTAGGSNHIALKSLSASEWLRLRKSSGMDFNSLVFTANPPPNGLPLSLPELAGKGLDGADIGAHLKDFKP